MKELFKDIYHKIMFRCFVSKIKPEMLPYKTYANNIKNGTGISNMTHISNKRNIVMGENVFVGHFNYIDGYNKIHIGDGCQITNFVSILTHSSHHSIRFPDMKNIEPNKSILSAPVEIGSYTYIGPHTVIMPGTIIGKGCLISAFSYISGNIPDYSVVRGIPGKIIATTSDIDTKLISENPEMAAYYYDKKA